MLYDDLAAELPGLRAHAESRMKSSAHVRRNTGHTEQDEDSGSEGPVYQDIYVGPARLGGSRSGASRSTTADYAQGVEVEYGVRVLSFPSTTTDLRDGDLIEITAGENVGTFWRLRETDTADQQTACRFLATATEQPEGW